MSDSIPPIHGALVDLQPNYGAMFIGVLFSAALLGVLSLQVWRYYNHFENDSKYLKLIVAIVWIIDFIRTAFGAHGTYYYLVLQWGNVLALPILTWTLSATLILASVVELVVRLFFTYRVWIMSSHNQVLTSVLTLVSLGDFGLGVYEYAITVQNSNLASLGIDPTFHNVGTVSLALSSGNDLAVSLSLIYYLHKGRTSNPRTTSIVKRIVLYTINQGLITSISDIITLGLFLMPTKTPQLYSLALVQVTGSFYANCLLASLNARIEISQDRSLSLTEFSTPPITSNIQSSTNGKIGHYSSKVRSSHSDPEFKTPSLVVNVDSTVYSIS